MRGLEEALLQDAEEIFGAMYGQGHAPELAEELLPLLLRGVTFGRKAI
jgi:hypothetical protein